MLNSKLSGFITEKGFQTWNEAVEEHIYADCNNNLLDGFSYYISCDLSEDKIMLMEVNENEDDEDDIIECPLSELDQFIGKLRQYKNHEDVITLVIRTRDEDLDLSESRLRAGLDYSNFTIESTSVVKVPRLLFGE